MQRSQKFAKTIVTPKKRSLSPTALDKLALEMYTPVSDLKLFFGQFQAIYREFVVMDEITTKILNDMGIFPKMMLSQTKF